MCTQKWARLENPPPKNVFFPRNFHFVKPQTNFSGFKNSKSDKKKKKKRGPLLIFIPLPPPLFVSLELCSERDYVITHSVRSMYMYRVYVVCMWYFAKLITVSIYIDVFPWDLDTKILRVTHVTSTDVRSKVI